MKTLPFRIARSPTCWTIVYSYLKSLNQLLSPIFANKKNNGEALFFARTNITTLCN